MNELHLFAGSGGGILGGILLGHTCVCAVEIEPYRRKILLQRQRDGILPKFPIWDDVRTFDGKPWRGRVDVVCGGFPCQDISVAGKGGGITGERSGLWSEMFRVVCEVRPRYVFVENSPTLAVRGLGRILGDLAQVGYDAKWDVLSAGEIGSPHDRPRIWILAFYPLRVRMEGFGKSADISQMRPWGKGGEKHLREVLENPLRQSNGVPQPLIRRVANGLANRVDRLAAIGDGQVPAVVRLAWNTLIK